MPVDGPQFAVCQAFPPPFISAVRPREEKPKEDQGHLMAEGGSSCTWNGPMSGCGLPFPVRASEGCRVD